MTDVFLDFETRSRVDLRACGVYRYAADPSTDVICLAYEIGDGGVRLWARGRPMPGDLRRAAENGATFHAHNATFERLIWAHVCVNRYGWPPIPLAQWRCTAAAAAAAALPRSLDRAAKALRLPVAKDLDGKRVMLKLSRPRK